MRWLQRHICIVMMPAVHSNDAACLYTGVCQMIWYKWCWQMVQQASVFHSKSLLSQTKPLHPFAVLHSFCCILSWPLQHAEVYKRQGTDLQPHVWSGAWQVSDTKPSSWSIYQWMKTRNGMPLYKPEECGSPCASQG